MNFVAYHLIRHTTCMAVAFVPRTAANLIMDGLNRLAPVDCEPVTFTDSRGNEVTL